MNRHLVPWRNASIMSLKLYTYPCITCARGLRAVQLLMPQELAGQAAAGPAGRTAKPATPGLFCISILSNPSRRRLTLWVVDIVTVCGPVRGVLCPGVGTLLGCGAGTSRCARCWCGAALLWGGSGLSSLLLCAVSASLSRYDRTVGDSRSMRRMGPRHPAVPAGTRRIRPGCTFRQADHRRRSAPSRTLA